MQTLYLIFGHDWI